MTSTDTNAPEPQDLTPEEWEEFEAMDWADAFWSPLWAKRARYLASQPDTRRWNDPTRD